MCCCIILHLIHVFCHATLHWYSLIAWVLYSVWMKDRVNCSSTYRVMVMNLQLFQDSVCFSGTLLVWFELYANCRQYLSFIYELCIQTGSGALFCTCLCIAIQYSCHAQHSFRVVLRNWLIFDNFNLLVTPNNMLSWQLFYKPLHHKMLCTNKLCAWAVVLVQVW